MRLLEHESKEILTKYRIPVPDGQVVTSVQDIARTYPVVCKAQIPMGGRGKAGGISIAHSQEEMREQVGRILNTPIRGYTAKRVLVEEKFEVSQEFYLAVTYDTVAKLPLVIFSSEGGVDVEELAQHDSQGLQRAHFSVRGRFLSYQAREMVAKTGITGKLLLTLGAIVPRLVDLFLDNDAILAEINPLALTADGRPVALDCHLEIDDDALPRHQALAEFEKDTERIAGGRTITEFERKAQEIDNLDHRGVAGRMIEFPGDMGLLIGGGGASLTAFDAVQLHGGKPANYCEIGGNPSVRKVQELTRHILSKPGVEKIAVIMNVVSNTRVDLVARGVVKGILAAGKVPADTVAVFRIPGAWEEEGFKILSHYGVAYCDRTISIDEAAKKAVLRSAAG